MRVCWVGRWDEGALGGEVGCGCAGWGGGVRVCWVRRWGAGVLGGEVG